MPDSKLGSPNPLLQQSMDDISAKVPPKYQDALKRTVLAGMKVMYDENTAEFVNAQMSQPGEPADNVGTGVFLLMLMLYKQSKNTLPVPVIAPAGVVLVCEALDFLEQSGKLKADEDMLANATQAFLGQVCKTFRVGVKQ